MLRPMKSVRETMYGLGDDIVSIPSAAWTKDASGSWVQTPTGGTDNWAIAKPQPNIYTQYPTVVDTAAEVIQPPADNPSIWTSYPTLTDSSQSGGIADTLKNIFGPSAPAQNQNRVAAPQKPAAPAASGSGFGPFVGALAKAFTAYTPLLTSNPVEAANQQAKLQAIQAKNALNVRNVSQTKSSLIPLALGAAGLLVVGLVVVTVLKRKGK